MRKRLLACAGVLLVSLCLSSPGDAGPIYPYCPFFCCGGGSATPDSLCKDDQGNVTTCGQFCA